MSFSIGKTPKPVQKQKKIDKVPFKRKKHVSAIGSSGCHVRSRGSLENSDEARKPRVRYNAVTCLWVLRA